MKTLKHPQFLIPIIIIIIMLGWIGYQKINAIKTKQAEKQTAEQNIDIEDVDVDVDADAVDENTDESLSIEDLMPADTESDKINPTDSEIVNTDNWNSFTHKAYGYTIKFPKDWHWDGTNADILIISSQSIKSNDENLTANNLKIIKADQEIIEEIFEKSADAIIVSLDANFKAVYLRNNQFKNIIEQIIKSFEI